MFVIWFPFRRFPPSSQTNTIKFLDKAKIKAILINEGITMHRVVFYLAFVVAGRDKMVVAFENLKPRLHILVKIYRCNKSHHSFVLIGQCETPLELERTIDT